MRTAIAGLVTSALVMAQYQVTLKPQDDRTTRKLFGKGRDITVWNVGLCSLSPTQVIAYRSRIMEELPQIRDIANKRAIEVMARKSSDDPRSIVGNHGDEALTIVSQGLTISGYATRVNWVSWTGVATVAMQLLFRAAKTRSPNPLQYAVDLLPGATVLEAARCNDTDAHPYIILSEYVKNPPAQIGPITLR